MQKGKILPELRSGSFGIAGHIQWEFPNRTGAKVSLQFVSHLLLDDPLLDQDLRDLGLAQLDDGLHLVAGTGPGGGLISWRLGEGTEATLVDMAHFTGSASTGNTGLATPVGAPDQQSLAFGTAPDGGGVALLAHQINGDGTFGSMLSLAELPAGGGDVSALVSASVGGLQTLFVADSGAGQILVFRPGSPAPASSATPLGPGDALSFDGPTLLSLAETGGAMRLLALDQATGVLHAFDVDTATGALTPGGWIDGTHGLSVADPTAMEVITAHGSTWAVIGAAGSDSLSVVRIGENGSLTVTDHLLDTLGTRFGGAHGLSIAQAGDHVFVIAGGADDGLSLFRLLPDGRLLHMETLPHGIGLGLENVEDIGAAILGDQLQVFVAGDSRGGVSQFAQDVSGLGLVATTGGNAATLLSGTAGDDLLTSEGFGTDTLDGASGDDILVAGPTDTVLRGGAGADTFVISATSGRVIIEDFTPGTDRLDLSDLPFLRGPGQLGIEAGIGFARITFRDTVIELSSPAPVILDAATLFGTVFDWPDRLPIFATGFIPPITGTAGSDTLVGTNDADIIEGGAGNDAIFGGAGDDTLRGGDGHDLLGGSPGNDSLIGGAGNDSLFGADGDDTLEGGDGDDLLGGTGGNDSLIGGAGNDQIFGADGDDTLLGGDGDDMLGGTGGNDLLFGGAGADQLWGAAGHDTLWGEQGNDTLGGASGDDLMFGGAGHDEIWGAAGNDTVFGGDGGDTIGLYDGHDVADGGADDDEIWGGAGNDTVFGGDGDDSIGLYLGDDSADGGAGNDEVWGAAGNDTLLGGAGNDTLGAGNGNDSLDGGTGHDELWGGAGLDTLIGGEGDDRLGGGEAADLLDGGTGNDHMFGGGGADVFIFADGHGNDTIGDFDPFDAAERIDLTGVTAIGSLADVLSAAIVQGTGLLIDTGGGDSLLLDFVTPGDLFADDFLF